jgi:hypothetical protein
MLSYVYFGTNDLKKAMAFYGEALAPLGMRRCITNDPEWDRVAAGWGICEDDGRRELAFWIGKPFDQQPASVGNGSMVGGCFAILGIAFLCALDWLPLIFPLSVVVLHFGIIKREERYLERKFGDEYLRYASRVPRYFRLFMASPLGNESSRPT